MKDYAKYLKSLVAKIDGELKSEVPSERRKELENLKAKADGELLKVIWTQ